MDIFLWVISKKQKYKKSDYSIRQKRISIKEKKINSSKHEDDKE
jgi:hypothetical protein